MNNKQDFYAERNEESSFQSENVCPCSGDDPLYDIPVDFTQLLFDRETDDFDTCDIDWNSQNVD
eukprot:CAMPEP_0197827502 /NCGR_PEP_ID=MMETSP1437-20131217/4256_1 /TAXON_ID=49252 ORGANISM="Eucampia antarctica, Strain CCMP1452" /NCGR_SAMPLE_ID=MMETSP1437 /ASSEMBLY_ACC=CAM_ASM_001096 /LENGTH=63 /DNA_ID=CAMNT_0043428353 /DNA_START=508 /DNA_END=699 /DNA_ORIENTATION=+